MLTRNTDRVLVPNFPTRLNYDYDRVSLLLRVSAVSDDTCLNALKYLHCECISESTHCPTTGNTSVISCSKVTR